MGKLEGKTAIITGASKGIGAGIARVFAKHGARLVLAARGEAVISLAEELKNEGYEAIGVMTDVRDRSSVDELVKTAVKTFGGIDVLVNNAGVAPKVRQDLLEMTEESFDYVVGVNTKGTMFMTQAVARQMIKQPVKGRRRAVIVNISSSSVRVSSTNRGEYCISKAGVAMLTTLYADRLAKEDIQVYEIRPGVIDTDMTQVVHKKYSDLIEQGAFPIARWGTPDDIAGAVSAFCREDFIYSTGNYIDIDGGFHIQRL